MRNYDGVYACQTTRHEIERAGYVCAFTTLFSDSSCPTEVLECKHDGWAIRRAMKAWAKSQGIEDYRIFRATDYLRDLHGSATYEMFVKPTTHPRRPRRTTTMAAVAQPAKSACTWPDCGHDTNGTGYSPGCTGAYCKPEAGA